MQLFIVSGSPAWPGSKGVNAPFMANMSWQNGHEFVLADIPDTIVYRDNSFAFSNRFMEQAFRPGAISISQRVARRPVVIEGEVVRATREELAELELQLKRAAIRPHLKLRDGDRYINLSALKNFEWVWRDLSDRCYAFVRITWEAGDPFWYAWQRQEHIESIVISNEPYQPDYALMYPELDDTLAAWPVYPWIRFQAPVDDTIRAPITLRNNTDQQALFEIANTITQGQSYTVDGEAGTVTISGAGAGGIQHFSGQFLRFLPGTNEIYFKDDSSNLEFDLTFRWRERWL